MRTAWITALLIATNAFARGRGAFAVHDTAGAPSLERVLPCDRCPAPVVVRAPPAAPPVAIVPIYPVYVVPIWPEPESLPAVPEPVEPQELAPPAPPPPSPTPSPPVAPTALAPPLDSPIPATVSPPPPPAPPPPPPPVDTRPGPEVFHWVDAEGVRHYSTRVPADARARAVKIGHRASGVTVIEPAKHPPSK